VSLIASTTKELPETGESGVIVMLAFVLAAKLKSPI
jgi:hypothetical protein